MLNPGSPTLIWGNPRHLARRAALLPLLTLAAAPAGAPAAEVLFIGAAAGPTQGADGGVMSFLQDRYGAGNVTYQPASATAAGEEAAFDLLVISSTLGSSQARGKFHNSAVGIVNWEEALVDDDAGEFQMAAAVNKPANQTQVNIADNGHAVTAGFALGALTIFDAPTETVGLAGAAGAGVEVLAGAGSGPAILVAEQGAALVGDGSAGRPATAPGRRALFPITDTGFANLNADGLTLFGRLLDWAAGSTDPPAVANGAATSVDKTSARVSGTVTSSGGANPTVRIYYGDNDGGDIPLFWDSSVNLGVQAGAFAADLDDLSPGTVYFYRAFAENEAGPAWAPSTASFETAAAGLPALELDPAAEIATGAARLGGEVTDPGVAAPSVTLFWGPADEGTNAFAWANTRGLGAQAGLFSELVGNLDPATEYFFTARALNAAGAGWPAASFRFTTVAAAPEVTNTAAEEVDFTSALIGGTVGSTGGEAPEVTLYYGDEDGGTDPGAWATSVVIGAEAGAFSTTLINLRPGTAYFFRAFVENSGGSAWAPGTESFQTLAVSAPALGPVSVASVFQSGASISGEVTGTGGEAPLVTVYFGRADGGTDPDAWDHSLPLGPQGGDFEGRLGGLQPETAHVFRAAAVNSAGVAWSGAAVFTTTPAAEFLITEFMASNATTNVPNATPGRFDDWIEIHNPGDETADIGGWHLSDDDDVPDQWTFPGGTDVPAGGYLVVFASGEGAPDGRGNLHTNFQLNAGGDRVILARPDLTVASAHPADAAEGGRFPDQFEDISYGDDPGGGGAIFFSTPTPGAANAAGAFLFVADTKFDFKRGLYSEPFAVTITTETPGATIRYTTNGSLPTPTNGVIYTSPVPVSGTTTLRAAAFRTGYRPTNVDTQTYLFPGDVLTQTAPPGHGALPSGDYNVDTRISQSLNYRARMLDGLASIPSLSVVLPRDSFFNGGIHSNPGGREEAPCSAELIYGDGREGFQIDCAIRMQGGASRNPSASPKHAMSLRFRAEYGPTRLEFPLFPGSPVSTFNSIALRAGYNNTWIHRTEVQRQNSQHIRDQWMRDSLLDMGHRTAGHAVFCHIFVNGLYWGVYQVAERQDASHYAAHYGLDDEEVDATNGGQFIDGNSTAFNAMRSAVAAGNWAEVQRRLNVDKYIDYTILQRYGANHDLKSGGNWRSAGGGPDGHPFEIYSWDSERVLELPGATQDPIDPFNIRSQMAAMPEYRLRFADRLQKHFFNGGALTPEACIARWMQRADELDTAIIAESARWGDHRRGSPYTRDTEWMNEQNRLVNSYFPSRANTTLGFYRGTSLFPATPAPVFNQHGGRAPPGFSLTLTAQAGIIYYTIDGTDPRVPGTDPGAGPMIALLAEDAPKRAAVPTGAVFGGGAPNWRQVGFDDSTWAGGTGGAGYDENPDYHDELDPALDLEAQLNGVNESLYLRGAFTLDDPGAYTTLSLQMMYDDGFVAYLNGFEVARANAPGSVGVDPAWDAGATGNHSDGEAQTFVSFDLTPHLGRLRAGANVLAVHGLNSGINSSDMLILPRLLASEDNGGGNPPGVAPGAVRYTGPVALETSAQIMARTLNAGEWSPLTEAVFTVAEEAASPDNLAITEVHYNPAGSDDYEFIEFKNTGPRSIDLEDVHLSGEVVFTFPPLALEPGEFVLVVEDEEAFAGLYLDPASPYHVAGLVLAGVWDGRLSNGGGELHLTDATGAVVHSFTYADGGSWPGRADGTGSSLEVADVAGDRGKAGTWRSSRRYHGSPGSAGDGPADAPVVNEVLSHPAPGGLDQIEIFNPSGAPVDLGGYYLSDSNDALTKFRIPPGTVLGAGAYLVFDGDDFDPTPENRGPGHFGLSGTNGDDVWLVEADAAANVLTFIDHVEFRAAVEGESFGRWPEVTGRLHPMLTPTPGAPNAGARRGSLIFSEIHYHPAGGEADEFFELRNVSGAEVALAHPDRPDLTWRVDGAGFQFPEGVTLAPGGLLVVSKDDPAAFRARHGVPAGVAVLGPYAGNLDNDGEVLTLLRPDGPVDDDGIEVYPEVVVESVRFNDAAPWPAGPDGAGPSLERVSAAAFGDFSAAWRASAADGGTPGTVPATGAALTAWRESHFSAGEQGDPDVSGHGADPDGDGVPNLLEFAFGSDPRTPEAGRSPAALTRPGAGADRHLGLAFRRRPAAGLLYVVELSDDLATWRADPGDGSVAVEESAVDNGDGTETVTVRDATPLNGRRARFIRVVVFTE